MLWSSESFSKDLWHKQNFIYAIFICPWSKYLFNTIVKRALREFESLLRVSICLVIILSIEDFGETSCCPGQWRNSGRPLELCVRQVSLRSNEHPAMAAPGRQPQTWRNSYIIRKTLWQEILTLNDDEDWKDFVNVNISFPEKSSLVKATNPWRRSLSSDLGRRLYLVKDSSIINRFKCLLRNILLIKALRVFLDEKK